MNKPSIWFWIIAIVLLLWNGFGVYDFIMTLTRNEEYLASYPQEMLDYWYSFPGWVVVVWGVAVISATLGAVLMLLRNKLAVPVFIISFIGFVLTTLYSVFTGGMAMQVEYLGAAAYGFTALVAFLTIFSIWYSRRAKSKGYLR